MRLWLSSNIILGFIQSVENFLEISISILPFGDSETVVLLLNLQDLTTVWQLRSNALNGSLDNSTTANNTPGNRKNFYCLLSGFTSTFLVNKTL